jgi:hypothetical protein
MVQQRQQYQQDRNYVIRVQALARGVLARKEANRERAAIKIQAWWRMIRQKKQYEKTRHAFVLLQSQARGLLARHAYQKTQKAAVLLQAVAKFVH